MLFFWHFNVHNRRNNIRYLSLIYGTRSASVGVADFSHLPYLNDFQKRSVNKDFCTERNKAAILRNPKNVAILYR